MSKERTDIESWVRYFRLAKTMNTLEVMRERCAEKAPEWSVMINVAASHRESEIIVGRLLEINR